ncbi:hypothetical protein Pmani_006206 [Petrolisthes manimaculis]|uniref:Uncharacterized protein n=1 Tax=Petrolisthes manimaculis TaxID=1843537 RepID=A0AAE1QC81_9EUCA|nr:hypothetical protein Pmani_006206 [Petrolisthes manimaculis]
MLVDRLSLLDLWLRQVKENTEEQPITSESPVQLTAKARICAFYCREGKGGGGQVHGPIGGQGSGKLMEGKQQQNPGAAKRMMKKGLKLLTKAVSATIIDDASNKQVQPAAAAAAAVAEARDNNVSSTLTRGHSLRRSKLKWALSKDNRDINNEETAAEVGGSAPSTFTRGHSLRRSKQKWAPSKATHQQDNKDTDNEEMVYKGGDAPSIHTLTRGHSLRRSRRLKWIPPKSPNQENITCFATCSRFKETPSIQLVGLKHLHQEGEEGECSSEKDFTTSHYINDKDSVVRKHKNDQTFQLNQYKNGNNFTRNGLTGEESEMRSVVRKDECSGDVTEIGKDGWQRNVKTAMMEIKSVEDGGEKNVKMVMPEVESGGSVTTLPPSDLTNIPPLDDTTFPSRYSQPESRRPKKRSKSEDGLSTLRRHRRRVAAAAMAVAYGVGRCDGGGGGRAHSDNEGDCVDDNRIIMPRSDTEDGTTNGTSNGGNGRDEMALTHNTEYGRNDGTNDDRSDGSNSKTLQQQQQQQQHSSLNKKHSSSSRRQTPRCIPKDLNVKSEEFLSLKKKLEWELAWNLYCRQRKEFMEVNKDLFH